MLSLLTCADGAFINSVHSRQRNKLVDTLTRMIHLLYACQRQSSSIFGAIMTVAGSPMMNCNSETVWWGQRSALYPQMKFVTKHHGMERIRDPLRGETKHIKKIRVQSLLSLCTAPTAWARSACYICGAAPVAGGTTPARLCIIQYILCPRSQLRN